MVHINIRPPNFGGQSIFHLRTCFISVQPLAVQLSLSPTGRDYFQSPMVTSTTLPVQAKSSPIMTSKKPVDFSDISSLSS